jgi:hypothetical protein
VVLVGISLVQWLLNERRRRQIVFLPSFRRSRGGSSLVRSTSSPTSRPQAPEPSTVDAPQSP